MVYELFSWSSSSSLSSLVTLAPVIQLLDRRTYALFLTLLRKAMNMTSATQPASPFQNSVIVWKQPARHPFALLLSNNNTFFIHHQSKSYKTRYLLHYLQNILRYYKYNTTRSKISCLPRGFRKGGGRRKMKKIKILQNYIELCSKRKFTKKGGKKI